METEPFNLVSGQCTVVHYDLVMNDFAQRPSMRHHQAPNTYSLYVFYPWLVINSQTRQFHIDLNDFVSAVGGSLGLFLGFSVLAVFYELYAIIQRESIDREKRRRIKSRKRKRKSTDLTN